MGGYIRYLYKAATKRDVYVATAHKDNQDSISPGKFGHETFEEISEIILAGLLAIIVWFIISQGTINTNIYTLGAVSLTVGLITKEIVQILKNFSKKF